MTVPSTNHGYEWELVPTPRPVIVEETDIALDRAESVAEREIWRLLPSRHPAGGTLEPLSLEWFQHLEEKRYRRHGRWVPGLLELNRHAKENILAIGDGLGTDWVQLAGAETNVTVVEPIGERLKLYRKHFSVRDAAIQLLHAPFSHLPLSADRIDVAIVFFHEVPADRLDSLTEEIFRVLRPGGKLILVVPGKYNASKWQNKILPWRWWRESEETSPFTSSNLKSLCKKFEKINVSKRHLRRSELPYAWRWLPLPLLERMMGRFLILKAFKPLQSAPPIVRIAA